MIPILVLAFGLARYDDGSVDVERRGLAQNLSIDTSFMSLLPLLSALDT